MLQVAIELLYVSESEDEQEFTLTLPLLVKERLL